MGWEGCRRRDDCATEVVTQRNVSLVWPGREHRRDPESQLSLGCARGFPIQEEFCSSFCDCSIWNVSMQGCPEAFPGRVFPSPGFYRDEWCWVRSDESCSLWQTDLNPPALGALQGTPTALGLCPAASPEAPAAQPWGQPRCPQVTQGDPEAPGLSSHQGLAATFGLKPKYCCAHVETCTSFFKFDLIFQCFSSDCLPVNKKIHFIVNPAWL